MAAIANREIYVQEYIPGFETRVSNLKATVASHANIQAATAYFLLSNSGREARGRGPNGLIPAAQDDLTQKSVSIEERHDLSTKTHFQVWTGHADQRRIMRNESYGTLQRSIDKKIIDTMEAGSTQTVNTVPTVLNDGIVIDIAIQLANADVPIDGQMFAVITPAMHGALIRNPTYSSSDYRSVRPYEMGLMNPQTPMPEFKDWLGFKWVVNNQLPGKGTNSAKCFFYHQTAIGHALDHVEADLDYDRQQAYYWTRHSIYDGASVLQPSGLMTFLADDTMLSQTVA